MGRLGTHLILGVVLGLFLLDLGPYLDGDEFSGAGLLAGSVLGAMVLPPGVACWLAGRKMRRERNDASMLSPRTTAVLGILILVMGVGIATHLGLPTP